MTRAIPDQSGHPNTFISGLSLETLLTKALSRQQRSSQDTSQRKTTSKVEHPCAGADICADSVGREERLSCQGRDDAKKSTPETCYTTCCAANRSREDLRRPAVKYGVEGRLEEAVSCVNCQSQKWEACNTHYSIMFSPMLAGCVLTVENTNYQYISSQREQRTD
jgi:hypothetical protein